MAEKEYIERGMVLELLKDVDRYGYLDASDINNIPAADVAPVRHGRWEKVIPSKSAAKWSTAVSCSECHMKGYTRYSYCPNCGALMDLEGGNK